MKSPTPDKMEKKSHCKPVMNLINHEDSFNENNLPSDGNKVIKCVQ